MFLPTESHQSGLEMRSLAVSLMDHVLGLLMTLKVHGSSVPRFQPLPLVDMGYACGRNWGTNMVTIWMGCSHKASSKVPYVVFSFLSCGLSWGGLLWPTCFVSLLGFVSSKTHEIAQLEQWGEPFLPAHGVMTAAMPGGTWREEQERGELREGFR